MDVENQVLGDISNSLNKQLENLTREELIALVNLKNGKIKRNDLSSGSSYSIWPSFHYAMFIGEDRLFDQDISIENLEALLCKCETVGCNDAYRSFYSVFSSMFDIQFKKSSLYLNDHFAHRVKGWLNNDQDLFAKVFQQSLVCIYNKFTFEENVYNLLRQKKPVRKSDEDARECFDAMMKETIKSCDFCSEINTAHSSFGRMRTPYCFSAANVFPFDKYHELFISREHDLTKMNYDQLKDLLYMPIKWFDQVNQQDSTHHLPTITWDYLYQGGASQAHPHIHGTLREDRYYGTFESIRRGAECYYRHTRRNYFADLVYIHSFLGLAFYHQQAVLIFPLTPVKDYEVIIMSQEFNESVVELLYSLLKVYEIDLKIFTFSMSAFYPSINDESSGRIPLYLRMIPRGEITGGKSDVSSLELMTCSNVNTDQFLVAKQMKSLIATRLPK